MDRDFAAQSPATRTALLVFLPFAAGYFLSYLYRSVNAVISTDLIDEFGLSASALGLLTSAYFLGFASLQIPVGLMLDRIGPRRTNSFLLLLAGSGAVVFSMADGLSGLLLGRALIGFGVAACLMSSIKVFTLWFPLERLPAMTGRMMFVGGLGAISATVPVEAALRVTDWRGLFLVLGVATFAAAALIYLAVPEKPDSRPDENFASQIRGTVGVFVSPLFWKIALGTTLFQSFNMAVQGLWAGPWLVDVAGLGRQAVAFHLLALGVATMCGFLFWGQLAARLARRGIAPMTVLIFASAFYMAVQLLLVAGASDLALLIWIGWGFFGTAGSLAFAILSQEFPVNMTGRATTALNLLVFLTAFASQWVFGVIVNRWPLAGGGYQPGGYAVAFGAFLALQFAGFVWMVSRRR
ncbi:MAG: MFS transporter [Betaproteobacteria bacterium]|nr:MAG: MFS transporter [Betaproteobacteria bacterium]